MKTTNQKPEVSVDAVIREVRQTKERLGAKYGFDVRRIAEAARAQQKSSGHPVVYREKAGG